MVSLALDPPPSSSRGRAAPRTGFSRAALFAALLGAVVVGFVVGRWTAPGGKYPVVLSAGKQALAPAPAAVTSASPAPAPAAIPGGGSAAPAPGAPVAAAAAAAPSMPAAAPAAPSGPRRLVAALSGALEETIAGALSPGDKGVGPELTQVVNRLLVWDLQVARDGRRGDRIEILWSPAVAAAPGLPGSGEPTVETIRFASQKLGRTFAVYRYQAPGSKYARYYRGDGSELEERLVDAPVADYDQVTSLLRDGRRHKGVDFRTPAGTPVFATFDGVIERRTWNFAGNGNCLDVKDAATGRHAIYLHLEVLPKDMVPGRRVKKGDQIALSGNSGHSFAPHLHYQLESPDGAILDPFAVQATRKAALDAAQKPGFEARRGQLEAALAGTAVAAAK